VVPPLSPSTTVANWLVETASGGIGERGFPVSPPVPTRLIIAQKISCPMPEHDRCGAITSVARFNTRAAPPGTKWHYASAETEVLGLVLRAAIGKPITDYLGEKIWQQIGTEADASWIIDGTGQEATFCCFNAVLRDYARLGRLLAHDGAWEGRQLIPRQWLLDATTVRPTDGYLAPRVARPFFGYGYQVWIFPGEQRRFALLGLQRQMILVDPASKLVMVHTAVRQKPSDSNAETIALWLAILEQLGK
jgi:CubicO group peptidase (beta-lactamase class C family)